MAEQTMPVDKAIATLDAWAGAIAGHVANDNNLVRARLEARYALGNIGAIANELPLLSLATRQSFYRASLNLLSVIRTVLNDPADKAACDRLRSVIKKSG